MSARRVIVAQVMHETNTFSMRPATLETFRQREWLEGAEILEGLVTPAKAGVHPASHDTNTELAGFFEVSRAENWNLMPVLATEATPCGRVSASAWDYFRHRIIVGIREHGPLDAVLLALHGAMVSERAEDADGELVAAVRAIVGPDVFVGCTLDLHANPSELLASSANVLLPYRKYPHVDMRERGQELAQLASRLMCDSSRWQSHVFRTPQLDGCDHGRSSGVVMPQLLDMADRASRASSLLVGVCAGFPWADVPHAGPCVIVNGNVDRETAARAAEPILTQIWKTRAQTSLATHDPASACEIARDWAVRGKRVLIADFTDNPGGGGYGTTTALLDALLKHPAPPSIFAPICDAKAARLCAEANVGTQISVSVGGNPDGPFSGPPLTLSGILVRCGDVQFRATGPMWTHREMRLGTTALIACGHVEVVITSYPLQVTEPAYLTACGADFAGARIIAIKSLQHFRAAFAPLVDEIIFADSGGLVSSDYRRFPYARVRRPIWPLDVGVTYP